MQRFRRILLYAVLSAAALTVLYTGWIYVSGLDSKHTYYIPAYRSERTLIPYEWQYLWGDSPLDSEGRFSWLNENGNESWTDFHFPGRPANSGGYRSIWFRFKLPMEEIDKAVMRLRTPQNTVEMYYEGSLIYRYGTHDPTAGAVTPGSGWHFVELPEGYEGKTLYLRLSTPVPHLAGYLTQAAVGRMSAHYLDIMLLNVSGLISGSLFIFIGLTILIFQMISAYKKSSDKYLGLGSVFLGGWFLSESNIFQIFTHATVSMTYSANFFIFLTPVWLLIYTDNTFMTRTTFHSRLLRIQALLHTVFTVVAFAADRSGLITILYFVRPFHVHLAASFVATAVAIVRSAIERKRGIFVFCFGVMMLGITGLLDVFRLFYASTFRAASYSDIGMLIFLGSLMINAGIDLRHMYKKVEQHSKEYEANYKSLFSNMTDGFTLNRLEYDEEGHMKNCTIVEVNDAFAKKVGKGRQELIGTDLLHLFPEMGRTDQFYSGIFEEIAATRDNTTTDNAVELAGRWYRLSVFYPQKDHISIIFSDVTAMKEAEKTIRRQAYTDSMTGFYNRTYFEEVMSRMNVDLENLSPLSIIAIDIDGLKITNDTFGHNAGDELLKRAADIIRSVFWSHGIISRVGGDEFCIILPNTDHIAAQEKSEQIIKIIDSVNSSNPAIPISMSVGTATSEDELEEDIYSIYRKADDDMYRYKINQSSSEKSRVIDMLLTALSEKDFVLQGHVERISQLCQQMADALGLHESEKRNLILLSKVHDIGKLGMPDEILNKSGKLTNKEYEKMKTHVKVGYNIASRSKELVSIAPFILHHHEYWNGKGYPSGLKGDEIPLECRILGIIDAFDAMTNDRPYHKGISVEEAIEEIRRCSGEQFDPVLAEKFIEIVSG